MEKRETGFRLGGDGNREEDAESGTEQDDQAVLETAYKKLSELARQDGVLVQLTKQEVGLLKTLIHAPDKADDFIRITLICDFLDDDEANRELDAFYEAVRLGMDTNYNIAHALSRAAINRKGGHRSSRVAMLLDTLSHQKFTSNQPRHANANINSRSPLA